MRFPISAEPVGYPESAVICGVAGCNNPGLVWLLGSDAIEYRRGRLCFPVANNKVKVLVKPLDDRRGTKG
jgi:hypothetical protein